MVEKLVKMQIGKKGITPGLVEAIVKSFKNRDWIKITVLKSHSRDKKIIKRDAEIICKELKNKTNKKYFAKIIGFTINIRKWRK